MKDHIWDPAYQKVDRKRLYDANKFPRINTPSYADEESSIGDPSATKVDLEKLRRSNKSTQPSQ